MKRTFSIIAFAFLATSILSAQADRVKGVWITASDSSSVKIIKHTNGKYIGHINWMMEPNDAYGRPKLDKNNPDPKKQNEELIGLKLLRKFEYNKRKNRWENGTIYDPDNGKTYSCYMWFEDGDYNTLYLKGYVMGLKFLGRETIWKRKR
ncbi:MAG TPA: DUF2147 domain-containing protein [Bacteroidales bacterium]|nr:DUF2147 domain-containing protein [Bacteroidales bacterium]